MTVMTVDQFIDKLNLALKKNTLYVMGGFGAPLTPANKIRYINKIQTRIRRGCKLPAS